ncbi:MAG TPA: MFS transporter [Pirellulales bacterium]|nr:MFS transporter [Pirellulales bacterium]
MSPVPPPLPSSAPAPPGDAAPRPAAAEITRLRDLSAVQWKSGAAAWLGWLFDGLDMHLYTLVAAPFVAELLGVPHDSARTDPSVGYYGSWIQAAFLVGWALGGSLFGRLGDRIGRSRSLMLTILTYASFTGLSFVAQTWWQLMLFRFLAALGIGGEWAVGSALISETWPRRWRPWLAAVLQTAVNLGTMLAGLVVFVMAGLSPRWVFLVGILPALLVLWIRFAVPEPEEWHAAKDRAHGVDPRLADLFRGRVLKVTLLTISVCSLSLSAHWAFLFWYPQFLRNLPELASWTDAERSRFVSQAMTLVMVCSIVGNFLAAAIARVIGYRWAIVLMCSGYAVSMTITYGTVRGPDGSFYYLILMGIFQGVFGLFTMYLPPLFPTLLRTTGAGFCYNIGRVAAAFGTVFFGLFSKVGDYRLALLYAGYLFLPAALFAAFLPEPKDDHHSVAPVD